MESYNIEVSCPDKLNIDMKSYTSTDQALVREMNLSLVLRYIHNEAPVSRAQIAQSTGLNKSTVSNLVEFLLERRLIHETGIDSVGKGRPARLLEINPMAGAIIGAEFGVDYIAVALTDFTGNVLWRESTTTDFANGQQSLLAQTLKLIVKAMDFSEDQSLEPLGLGIAAPGTVNLDDGFLIFAPNLQWRNVPLKRYFTENTGLKVFVENDANAAAIAESLFGNARKCRNFIFFFAGVGIGCGLFLNGELYRGNVGYSGEIGHSPIMLKALNTPCHCGNRGCWELYANQFSILQRMQARLKARRDTIIPQMMEEQDVPLSLFLIKQAADAGDEEAIEALMETGTVMGIGCAILINLLDPGKIIFGGPLSVVGEYMLSSIEETVKRHVLPELRSLVNIELSSFGKDSSLIGAISMVVDNILSNPAVVERREVKRERLGLH